jgi:hypothetical protein
VFEVAVLIKQFVLNVLQASLIDVEDMVQMVVIIVQVYVVAVL